MAAYFDVVLNGELDTLNSGAGRNNALFKAAARLYQFCEIGVIDDGSMTDLLTERAASAGLGRNEIRATLKSAQKAASRMDERQRGELRLKVDTTRVSTLVASDPYPPETLTPPSELWRLRADAFIDWAGRRLWRSSEDAERERAYLYRRGLTNHTIISFELGYSPADLVRSRADWGLEPDEDVGDRLWLPAGIVIPWFVDGALWRVTIRRPIEGPKKYYNVPGGTNTLFNVDSLMPGRPAVLVEGVFDAWAIHQAMGERCGVVASGTTGARRVVWMVRLALCRPVLVAFDSDPAGEEAAAWWLDALGQSARRWRPLIDDPAEMMKRGMDVRGWIEAGLEGV